MGATNRREVSSNGELMKTGAISMRKALSRNTACECRDDFLKVTNAFDRQLSQTAPAGDPLSRSSSEFGMRPVEAVTTPALGGASSAGRSVTPPVRRSSEDSRVFWTKGQPPDRRSSSALSTKSSLSASSAAFDVEKELRVFGEVPRRYGRTFFPDTHHVLLPAENTACYAAEEDRFSFGRAASSMWTRSETDSLSRRAQEGARLSRRRRNVDRVQSVLTKEDRDQQQMDSKRVEAMAQRRMRYLEAVALLEMDRMGVHAARKKALEGIPLTGSGSVAVTAIEEASTHAGKE